MRDISHEADFSVDLTDNVRKTLQYDWKTPRAMPEGMYGVMWPGCTGTGEAAEKFYVCKETIKRK